MPTFPLVLTQQICYSNMCHCYVHVCYSYACLHVYMYSFTTFTIQNHCGAVLRELFSIYLEIRGNYNICVMVGRCGHYILFCLDVEWFWLTNVQDCHGLSHDVLLTWMVFWGVQGCPMTTWDYFGHLRMFQCPLGLPGTSCQDILGCPAKKQLTSLVSCPMNTWDYPGASQDV